MAIVLGLVVAASFGSGDFLGGNASRRTPTLIVLALVQACALVGAIAYALSLGGVAGSDDLGLGAGAGALNVVALGCLYAGLATGRMGLVAPLTAVIAACIPVLWGLANGEDLGAIALIGVAVAIAAGGLIAWEHNETAGDGQLRALVYALVAGTLFGWSLVLYSETSHNSGAWPVLAGRVVSTALVFAVVVGLRRSMRMDSSDRKMAIGAGVLDVTATALLLIAVRDGFVAVVAPIAALGPAFTVMWAWVVLREPVGRIQLVGIAAGIAGLVMIAAG
jgi:uncharacterized membrane protein